MDPIPQPPTAPETPPAPPAPQAPPPSAPPAASVVIHGTRTERELDLERELQATREENARLKTTPVPTLPERHAKPGAPRKSESGRWTFFHEGED